MRKDVVKEVLETIKKIHELSREEINKLDEYLDELFNSVNHCEDERDDSN